MSPIRVGSARLDGEDLNAFYNYTQMDGWTESGTQIRWYMNGALQTSFNDKYTVPAATTQIGQTWYYTVLPGAWDPVNLIVVTGDLQTSPTVTIRSNTAPVTGTPTLDSMNGGTDYADEDLVTTAAATTDANSDPTTNIFHWTKGGVSQTNLQMPFDTEVPTINNTNGATNDYSGYGNNGVVNGSTWVQHGIVGGALSFNGNDYVTVQEHSNSLGGDGSWSTISVEFWIQASGATSTQTVVFKPDSTYPTSGYGLGYRVQYRSYADGYRVYWIVGNSSAQISLNTRITEGAGQWHHVVCTYQSGIGLSIYTDGLLRATLAGTGNINATANGLLYIGGVNSNSGDFVGQMDEVRIYKNVLSPAQIFQRYIETKDGLTANDTIVPQEIAAGDTWVCQVTPNDVWQDGIAKNSNSLTVSAVVGNGLPRINWYSPANTTLTANASDTIVFSQVSSDYNSNPLTYQWQLDGNNQATTQNWTSPSLNGGTHTVRVTVSDGSLTDYQQWTINVNGATQNAYLVIRGASNQINYRLYDSSINSWGTWNTLPGATIDSPAAFAVDNQLHIVVRGANSNQIWYSSVNLADNTFSGWTLLDGATPSAPTLTGNSTHLCLVVRGSNNIIFYRFYELVSSTWGSWVAMPNGATIDTPAAVLAGSDLHVSVRGVNQNQIWHGSVDVNTNLFAGWELLDGATPSTPTLTANSTSLCLVVRGNNNNIYYSWYNLGSQTWTSWIGFPFGTTPDTPAATITGDNLQIVVRGSNYDQIWHGTLNLVSNEWSGWTLLDGATPSKPILTS